jgi:hypothetical protein
VVVALVLAGCGGGASSTPHREQTAWTNPAHHPFPRPGDVVDASDWVSGGAPETQVSGKRILYRSTDINDRPIVVSGTVFVPSGQPPEGGWPVLALGHGSTGINVDCAPSLTPDLYGLLRLVRYYLRVGMAVTFADYAGLGTPSGPHPYLDPYAAARTVIDSVRAIRQLFPTTSTTWTVYGVSQGGGASWAADELAVTYAPELRLVGAVAQVPSTNKAPMVDLAVAGTLTLEQQGILQWLEESLARTHADFNPNDYRRGQLAARWADLSGCGRSPAREQALRHISASEFAPSSPAAAERLRALLQSMALPRTRLSAPLYVLYGGADHFNAPEWIVAGVRKTCELGGPVTITYDPDAGHGNVDTSGVAKYLADRVAGLPVHDDCRR